jgi:hypothetical protein
MAKEWLNHYVNRGGQWQPGQPDFLKSSNTVSLGGASVRIYETATSGDVVLSPVGKRFSSYGIAEVYLKIFFSDGRWEYLSAPIGTPIELANVESIELNLLFLVGNAGAKKVYYRALVNGHCVYERLSLGPAVDSNLISGATGASMPGQSYNETRALDVTVLSPPDLSVERMVLDGYRFVSTGGAVIGARIYDSSTKALVSTSQDVNLPGPSIGVPISIPVSATLVSGRSYRLGFYVLGNPQASSSADLFQPASFPYIENAGLFRINSTHSVIADAFPQGPNLAAPRVTITTRPV